PATSGATSGPVLTSCNFDYGLCSGWQQSYSDVFDWTRYAGSTSSSNTGPSSDHTSGSGYYMYIETSNRVSGDNAKLKLSVSGNRELSCLTFYYHMYGDTMGTLTVFNGNARVFRTSGNHSNYWLKAERTIYLANSVTFEGIVGSSYTGDLAIDDVSISSGSCHVQTTYPTLPPSTSPAGCYDNPVLVNICPEFSQQDNLCLSQWAMKNCRKSCGFCKEYSTTTSTFKSTITPQTPSIKERQESVMVKIRDLDMTKWNKQLKDDFKREVARVATDYCAADGARCQITPTSSRRRRSSENMVFSADMVHIVPGYPTQSPEDPPITLLAFYLQLPHGLSDKVVTKDILQAIVKSDMSRIEGSMGSTISSVKPLASTADTKEDEEDEENEEDEKESKPTSAIIVASVGGVLLFAVIGAFVLRSGLNGRVHNQKEVGKGVVEGNRGTDGGSTMNNWTNNAYDNNAYIIGQQPVELKFTNHTRSTEHVPVKKPEKHHPSTGNGLHVPANHSSVNEGFQELEKVSGN
ncbi:hypothetical protein OS493_027017, partial [Desmophyllum pertusum]